MPRHAEAAAATFGLVRSARFGRVTPWERRQLRKAAGRFLSRDCRAPAWAGSLTQLSGFVPVHRADQPLTRYRWEGRLHESTGSNMWSFITKSRAYRQ